MSADLPPDASPRALSRQGDRARGAGDLDTAARLYRAALAGDATFAPAWFGLGATAQAGGDNALAIAAIGRAVQLRPRAGWHAALSAALLAEGHAEAARAAARLAVETDPSEPAHHHAHALALVALGATDAALAAWRETARRAPRDPAAHANLAAALNAVGRIDEAAAAIAEARALAPPTAATLLTEGLVADAQGDVARADALLAEAERAAPGEPAIALGRASVLFERDRFDAAEARLRAILAAGAMPQAELTLASVLLATGRRAEGWAAFEARAALLPPSDLPPWDGQPTDAIVRLEAEQGLGDALHFLRYLPAARARARIVLRGPQAMRRLVADSFETIVFDEGEGTATCRAGLPSLPHLLGDPPADPVWIRLPPARIDAWRARFAGLKGRRLGIVWQGSPAYRYDRRRSIPPDLLAPLGALAGVSFVSLSEGAERPDWMAEGGPFTDLADTAAAIAALDGVVAVDTMAAHLAGAMGAPLWLLDRAGGDWRWREAFGPPLYPGLRRFVQPAPLPPRQAWPPVIARLAAALAAPDQPVGV